MEIQITSGEEAFVDTITAAIKRRNLRNESTMCDSARYGSTRLPGKPLALIQRQTGDPAYERVLLWPAFPTRSWWPPTIQRIADVVTAFGGREPS